MQSRIELRSSTNFFLQLHFNDLKFRGEIPKFEPVGFVTLAFRFPRFNAFSSDRKTALVPDNADLFSFLLSFLFLPARAVNIYTKPHILAVSLSLFHTSFHPIAHSLSLADTWSPQLNVLPPKKNILHIFQWFFRVCVFF